MRTGFVGLGAMGTSMARNLQRAGLLAAVWNRSSGKAQALAAELKVAAPATLAELAASCDAIVSCVSADADVLDVTRALAPALGPGALILDCSTVSAETARQAAQLLEPRGAEFLDCPVSGGVEGARDGTLAIMVGGAPAAFERARHRVGPGRARQQGRAVLYAASLAQPCGRTSRVVGKTLRQRQPRDRVIQGPRD